MIKKHIISILSLLILSVLLLTTAGTLTSVFVDNNYFSSKIPYKKTTKIASVNVTQKSNEEVQFLLADAITSWKNQSNIQLFLKEQPLDFSINEVQFLIEESLALAKENSQSIMWQHI